MDKTMIPAAFITRAASIIGATDNGLSGSEIASYCCIYATDFNVDIPHSSCPFSRNIPNKRTALKNNLQCFSPEQQFKIIKELCELDQFNNIVDVKDLKIKLIKCFSRFNTEGGSEEINEPLIEETRRWLIDHPEALNLYNDAYDKFQNKIYSRNLLDDLRLALEKLVQSLFDNEKSLENQKAEIGAFLKERNTSKELTNMFVKIIDYYSKYQNSYVKHDDAVKENEIEIIFEMTCSFMKFLIRLK